MSNGRQFVPGIAAVLMTSGHIASLLPGLAAAQDLNPPKGDPLMIAPPTASNTPGLVDGSGTRQQANHTSCPGIGSAANLTGKDNNPYAAGLNEWIQEKLQKEQHFHGINK